MGDVMDNQTPTQTAGRLGAASSNPACVAAPYQTPAPRITPAAAMHAAEQDVLDSRPLHVLF